MFLFLVIFNLILSLATTTSSTEGSFVNLSNLRKDDLRVLAKKPDEKTSFKCTNRTECPDNERYTCTQSPSSSEVYECVCTKEYAIPGDPKYESKCEYKRKRQLVAFLLELFVGFGAGHFYVGNYLIASLKLVAFLFGIYIICLFPLTAKCCGDCCDSDCIVVLISLFFFLCSVGLAFWFIWDLVYYGKNKYTDGKGVKLLSWSKKK